MKIITLCLATVFAGLAAGSALAAEGKLNFIGKVVNASCKLEGVSDSGVIGVSMGAIPLSRLKNSQSGTGPAVGIDIRVKDCEKGTYYIVVDGPSPAGTPENRGAGARRQRQAGQQRRYSAHGPHGHPTQPR